MVITFFTFAQFGPALKDFSQFYAPEADHLTICPIEPMTKFLRPRKDRTCRFCGLDASQTKFIKRAHAIPELLGNRHLLSDSECDRCNERFALLENDLAHYLGASRTLNKVQARNRIPTFKSAGDAVTMRQEAFYGVTDGMLISRDGTDNESFTFHPESGTLEIKYSKRPYTPLNVYRALLKIALSVMPEEHLPHYAALRALLLRDEANALARFATVGVFTVPYDAPRPRCHLSQKRGEGVKACSHMLSLYFQNYVYQLFLPLHRHDAAGNIYAAPDFHLHACPPLFFAEPDEKLADACRFEWRNLSGATPVTEDEVVTVNFAPNAFETTQVYDPATGETRDADGTIPDIVKLYWTEGDERPNFPSAPL